MSGKSTFSFFFFLFVFSVFLFTTTHLPVFTVENHFSESSTSLKQYQRENSDLIAFYFRFHFIQSFKLTAMVGTIEICAER